MALMWHAGEPDDGVLWVEINWRERPVNALSRATLSELAQLIVRIRGDAAIRGVVFKSGKRGNFIAGADIAEFQQIRTPDEIRDFGQLGQQIFDDLVQLSVPTVALISGACLGGGLEFALACRYRIADTDHKTKLGLPEVMLGIVPGWGGTVRLPRTVGFVEAVPLLLTGRMLNGRQAARKGLVHDAVPAEALDNVARSILRTEGRAVRQHSLRGAAWLIDHVGPLKRLVLWQAARQTLAATHGHYPAPFEILEMLRGGLGQSHDAQLALVRDANARLGQNPVTRELVRIFFLSEGAKKTPPSLGLEVEPDAIEHAAVVGAGAMGAGIALLMARRRIWTRLKDLSPEFVSRGLKMIHKRIKTEIQRRRITPLEGTQAVDHITPTTDYRGLKQTEIVIEAVVEELDVKRSVFAELAKGTAADCVLATNTSSLLVADVARDVPSPERVVGLHFFNPVHQMPLVEVVRGPRSNAQSLAKAAALAARIGKTPVFVRDCHGFLVNRVFAPFMNEAGYLLSELEDPMQVETASLEFGMPMGPLSLIDLVGLDVSNHVSENLYAAYGERMQPAPLWKYLRETYSTHKDGLPKIFVKRWRGKTLNPAVRSAIAEMARRGGTPPMILSHATIIERLIYPVVNEATRCLDEKIADRPDDVDLAMILGTGFAPFRGGPLRFADSVGIRRIVEALDRLASQHSRFAPCERLRGMATAGERFYPGE